MQPLNPFLSAFFRSSLPSQCAPIQTHILLVPTTEILLTSRDRETGTLYSELASTEDFLASHVLRIPGPAAGGKDVSNMRESRGRAKQYSTLNGRTLVIKDSYVYSNKGFRTLNSAQLVKDVLWYPDSLEPRSWLVYYISKPLVGILEEIKIIPATLPFPIPEHRPPTIEDGTQALRKKDVKTFGELLSHFPMIARQMQPGLERLFKEFQGVFEKPLPLPPSSRVIPDPVPDGPITTAVKRARSSSMAGQPTFQTTGNVAGAVDDEYAYAEDDEDIMRGALETAVTAAIDLFQMVDKQQLSLLGATTDLTGPVVERLIERYVTEQVHDVVLYPKLCALKRPEDLDLERNIRQMEFVDISQVGIGISGGQKGKHELTLRIQRAVEEFRKMGVAGSPQQMLEILLATLKAVTHISETPDGTAATAEKVSAVLTINADTLVSLLLVVVIRAQVRYLQARLLYMRHFIFIDDVESGEIGYALSTFEAVLSYLARDSGGLRRASKRNKKLWQATTRGALHEMMKIMEPEKVDSPEDSDDHEPEEDIKQKMNGHSRSSSRATQRSSQASTLNHVFVFESSSVKCDSVRTPTLRRPKTVTMDMRSMSSNSEMSFLSRATTIDSTTSGIEGDTSIERLSQTEDASGESVLMMAVQHERPKALAYLLSLSEYYPAAIVLEDINNEGTTLLSAAVQLGNMQIIDIILDFVYREPVASIREYLAVQDLRGRSVAHYLFNAPQLISRVGGLLPWRQRDRNGQTPLFALCRSYDHGNYRAMVEAALSAATHAQGDGELLHLDDHIDAKGNTLLHISNDPQLTLHIMANCDADVNATNDKKFTSLMVASKYGRTDMVRALFADSRVDVHAKELRGLTAVELAKDDEVRNSIDDMILFSGRAADDGRLTAVVRSFFVEDATIRLVVKSAAPSSGSTYTVTTCRRSLTDFENLIKLLALENPSSWLPSITGLRSPFQIPSKPSRAVLRDTQLKLDGLLKLLLAHTTFATHEMLWEFFLMPELQHEMIAERSKLKAETRVDRIREEYEPIEDTAEVEQFVDHAREMVRGVHYATKSVIRRTNALRKSNADLFDAGHLASSQFANLPWLPPTHVAAMTAYFRCLSQPSNTPHDVLHTQLLTLHSTLIAHLLSLSRPQSLIQLIQSKSGAIKAQYASLGRSTRWPLGLLDDTRQRLDREKEKKIENTESEKEDLGRELRECQQTVASELAGWQDWRARESKRAIRELVKGCLSVERQRLESLNRAIRKLRPPSEVLPQIMLADDVVAAPVEAEDLDSSAERDPPVLDDALIIEDVAATNEGQEENAIEEDSSMEADLHGLRNE